MTNKDGEKAIPRVTREEKYPGITGCSNPAGRREEKMLNIASFIQEFEKKAVRIVGSVARKVGFGEKEDFGIIKAKDTVIKPKAEAKDRKNIVKGE